MQYRVTIVVELGADAGVSAMEGAIQAAGWRAMRAALQQAARCSEDAHPACPYCGSAQTQPQGIVARRVLTCFGRVVLGLCRERCLACGQRFRPAQTCLAELEGGNVTPELGAACALAGASWAYATAARVLQDLCGAQVSHEEVRRWTVRLGRREAAAQRQEAERLLALTAEQVRAERDAQARARRMQRMQRMQRMGEPVPAVAPPERLLVGLDGGWLPSREQPGAPQSDPGCTSGSQPPGSPPGAASRFTDAAVARGSGGDPRRLARVTSRLVRLVRLARVASRRVRLVRLVGRADSGARADDSLSGRAAYLAG